MTERKSSRNKLIWLILMMAMVLILSGCRSRITSDVEATSVIADPDGMTLDNFEMRRDDLGMGESKKSLFSGLFSNDIDDEDEYGDEDTSEYFDTEDMEDDYEYEEPQTPTDTTNTPGSTTTPAGRTTTTRPGTTPGTTYKPVTVTVSFNANGGTVGKKSMKVTRGKTYGSLPTPKRKGYTFEGWYTSQTGGFRVSTASIVGYSSNFTLYAHWKKNESATGTYTVTFNPNGGEIDSADKTKRLQVGDKYGTLPVPTREGYDFLGWYTAKKGGTRIKKSTEFKSGSNITLYAQWKASKPEEPEDPHEVDYERWLAKLETEAEDKVPCLVYEGNDKEEVLVDSSGGRLFKSIEDAEVVISFVDKEVDSKDQIDKIGNDDKFKSKNFRILIFPKEAASSSDKYKDLLYRLLVLTSLHTDSPLDALEAASDFEVEPNWFIVDVEHEAESDDGGGSGDDGGSGGDGGGSGEDTSGGGGDEGGSGSAETTSLSWLSRTLFFL